MLPPVVIPRNVVAPPEFKGGRLYLDILPPSEYIKNREGLPIWSLEFQELRAQSDKASNIMAKMGKIHYRIQNFRNRGAKILPKFLNELF